MNNSKLGLPLILPTNNKYFDYKSSKDHFVLTKKEIALKLFNTSKKNYIGIKRFFFNGQYFCTNSKPKKKYRHIVSMITSHNNFLKKKIKDLKKKKKFIGAFQTRNIPHLGHELIIKKLLKYCDHVIINPVIGPKKIGDFKSNILKLSYEYLSKKYYDNRLSYIPICANMFYAGPREAIHHALLRKSIGFTHFIVGRDHAGAENIYDSVAAFKMLQKYKNTLGINVITHQGSYYNKKTKKIVIKNDKISKKDLLNINGSDFRKHLKNKSFFKYARRDLQEYLYTLDDNYFIKY